MTSPFEWKTGARSCMWSPNEEGRAKKLNERIDKLPHERAKEVTKFQPFHAPTLAPTKRVRKEREAREVPSLRRKGGRPRNPEIISAMAKQMQGNETASLPVGLFLREVV